MEDISINDYCFASKYSDESPCDPWSVGYVEAILIDKTGKYIRLSGENVDKRWFKHYRKICKAEGEAIILSYPPLETGNYRPSYKERHIKIHYRDEDYPHCKFSPCGRRLSHINNSSNKRHVTCKTCRKIIEKEDRYGR